MADDRSTEDSKNEACVFTHGPGQVLGHPPKLARRGHLGVRALREDRKFDQDPGRTMLQGGGVLHRGEGTRCGLGQQTMLRDVGNHDAHCGGSGKSNTWRARCFGSGCCDGWPSGGHRYPGNTEPCGREPGDDPPHLWIFFFLLGLGVWFVVWAVSVLDSFFYFFLSVCVSKNMEH